VKWNRCAAPRGIAELFVRTALADFGEAEIDENSYDFAGFEYRHIPHESSDSNILDPDELGLQRGFAVFQKHCNDIVQIAVDFIQRFPLGMCTGKAWDETNEQTCLLAPFDYRRIDFHDWLQSHIENVIIVPGSATDNSGSDTWKQKTAPCAEC